MNSQRPSVLCASLLRRGPAGLGLNERTHTDRLRLDHMKSISWSDIDQIKLRNTIIWCLVCVLLIRLLITLYDCTVETLPSFRSMFMWIHKRQRGVFVSFRTINSCHLKVCSEFQCILCSENAQANWRLFCLITKILLVFCYQQSFGKCWTWWFSLQRYAFKPTCTAHAVVAYNVTVMYCNVHTFRCCIETSIHAHDNVSKPNFHVWFKFSTVSSINYDAYFTLDVRTVSQKSRIIPREW